MKFNRVTAFMVVGGLLAVAALNQSGVPVPGLTWLRADAIFGASGGASKSASDSVAATKTAAGADAKPAHSGSTVGGRRGGGSDGPTPVVVQAAATSDVPVYLRGVGTARAPQTVTVRPQIDGKLMKVHFVEGQDVKKGDLLAEIDPVTFQATLDQAIAKKKQDEALLANAKVDLDRYDKTGPGVTAQKTIDTQRSQVAQYEAQIRSDTAAVASAQAYVDYTQIKSPLDGRTGQRLVDEGNLVHSTDAGIVTIAQIKPIQVLFTLPQQQLQQVMAAMKAGPVAVDALAGDDRKVLDTGELSFIDNLIDATTGTVRMKAELPNDRMQLWPGQFSNVRVRVETLKNAVTAPTAAVQRGPQGTFVYVVKTDPTTSKSMVSVQVVTVTQQDDTVSVVTQGLAAGTQVVTSGFARLKDGAEVTITRTDSAPVAIDSDPAKSTTQAAPDAESNPDPARPERLGRADGDGSDDKPVRDHGKRQRPPVSALQ